MHTHLRNLTTGMAFMLLSLVLPAQGITTPDQYFGFHPGTDRMLFTYEQLIGYLQKVDGQSDRLAMFPIGTSPMGRPMYVACFSAPANLKNLDRLKEINRKLALDPDLPEADRAQMLREGKVFVLATMSMHSVEVAPSQSVPLTAYDWLTTNDPGILQALDNTVFMIVPCHNPDGMDSVVNYYNRNKGTIYEGSSLPGLYHKYVGHDNNRDFIVLTQTDTKAISALTSTDWFPQVMVEKHQMGSTGPRYFVPPNHDPIAENVDAELFIWTGVFGTAMISDMTAAGQQGVSQHTIFDNYWPGSTETCIWKNVIALLTEAASCQVAKPIYIEPTELTGEGKGLSEYKKSINMPDPWPGGWWRLSDIVNYELVSTRSLLMTASENREKILALRNDLCKKEVRLGLTQPPYYFLLPAQQADQSELVSLVTLLQEHGVNVFRLKSDVAIGQTTWRAGDIVVPLAQPYRAFIKEVMEVQKYPERHYTPGGELIEPYDITSWSLPLHKGLTCVQSDTRSAELEQALELVGSGYSLAVPFHESPFTILSSTENGSYRLIFQALAKGIPVKRLQADTLVNGTAIPAGSFLLEGNAALDLLKGATFPMTHLTQAPTGNWQTVKLPRIGMLESYFYAMDAGWTRYLLDTYGIPYTVIRPGDVASTGLTKKFDLLLLPDEDASVLKEGKFKRQNEYYLTNLNPRYAKGMGSRGLDSLVAFFVHGGKIVSWGGSTGLFDANLTVKTKKDTMEFRLPFRDVSGSPDFKNLNCPGSLIRMNLFPGTSLTWGMGRQAGIFYRGDPIFTTSIPQFDMDRRVVGYFGDENLLMSGFLQGDKLLARKSALVWLKKADGQMVLMAFSPIFRASVPGTYKLLFNAILMK